jgi:hypothetical protein
MRGRKEERREEDEDVCAVFAALQKKKHSVVTALRMRIFLLQTLQN